MSFDDIGSAMSILFDELNNDKASKGLIKKIDNATNDTQLKSGMVAGIKRLRQLGKHSLADDLEKKIKSLK